jgi:hypothetical protein
LSLRGNALILHIFEEKQITGKDMDEQERRLGKSP